MKLTNDFTRHRIAAENGNYWEDEYPEGADPELEEESRSRDWPEAGKPLEGGQLEWKGGLVKDLPGGGWASGLEWKARATDKSHYHIWAKRKLHEDWRGDFYEYEFNPVYVIQPTPNRVKKKETPGRREVLGSADTLAEAQKMCEDHFQEWIAD